MVTQIFCSLIILGSFLGCSSGDPKSGCYQNEDRSIVFTINSLSATIIVGDNNLCKFTIHPDEPPTNFPLGNFLPCNLAEEFKIDKARVVISGNVYESFDNEDICADFFEITEIEFIEP